MALGFLWPQCKPLPSVPCHMILTVRPGERAKQRNKSTRLASPGAAVYFRKTGDWEQMCLPQHSGSQIVPAGRGCWTMCLGTPKPCGEGVTHQGPCRQPHQSYRKLGPGLRFTHVIACGKERITLTFKPRGLPRSGNLLQKAQFQKEADPGFNATAPRV